MVWTICFKEFKSLFKSVKSIITIAILFAVSYLVADLMESVSKIEDLGLDSNGYAMGIFSIVFLIGLLLISGLSHDIINREINMRTMRFLVTKSSRLKILLGKFFGIWLFWLFCIIASYILISFVSKEFFWSGVAECMTFITVGISFTILFSVVIPKPGVSMFFSIIFSLVFPAISLWALFSSNGWISWFKYLTPFYYSYLGGYFILINLVYATIILYVAIVLFKRRDL
ncbi:ABC transporter permease subunit [Bacillus velezensis]|uniref:ABC transporter permease subunit n=1 Tax=Bacillus TaxID=1386 RepID=UPI00066EE54F|nr:MULTISPECIES: ABC transporter permease subunit [Bacillus]ARM29692.1 hypothetical protein B9C48_18415 [Bacillus vallismortis]ANF38671.1 hypothetical protein BCBMB205_37910 [Bacillus velezensis]ARB35142.1 hypothetical protein BAJT_18405 [Bacillus velezensis]ARZ60136.1 hypothetical protein BAGQ_3932 [Bacillus velezensis]KRT32278.1 hypothetical protein PV82_10130 [Bacillus velezensis]